MCAVGAVRRHLSLQMHTVSHLTQGTESPYLLETESLSVPQVGLELCQVHTEGPTKVQGSCDGGDILADEADEVGCSISRLWRQMS